MTAAERLPEAPLRKADAFDVSVMLPVDFRLQSGEKLARPEINLRLYGDLALPIVAVSGGISAGRMIADCEDEAGWWSEIVAPGGPIDLRRFCALGFDFLPNSGETARTISTHDQARALAFALDQIRRPRLAAFIGASYGGMVALAFAEEFGVRLQRLCVVSAADRPHPAATALRGVQRRIIEFAKRMGAPEEGVSLARQIAMTTYRTPEEFAERFAHAPGERAGDPYAVCDYLIARGAAYRMPGERYLTLSDSIDRHAIDPARIRTRALFITPTSDRLVPEADVKRLAARVADGACFTFRSLYGHDAFLKDAPVIGPVIKRFIEEASP